MILSMSLCKEIFKYKVILIVYNLIWRSSILKIPQNMKKFLKISKILSYFYGEIYSDKNTAMVIWFLNYSLITLNFRGKNRRLKKIKWFERCLFLSWYKIAGFIFRSTASLCHIFTPSLCHSHTEHLAIRPYIRCLWTDLEVL